MRLASVGVFGVMLLGAPAADAAGEHAPDDPLDMSIEQLLEVDVRVPSALTKWKRSELPASVTLITADDIARTPARNIYDLIEVYVPGALWMNHEEGPHPGVRGHNSSRSYTYLLLVNGRVLNSKAHYGAKSELEHWELGDIERIEIVRGPGSVTYGPGAVAGVISITTRDASTAKAGWASVRAVEAYGSVGAASSYRFRRGDTAVYLFGSVARTTGADAPQFLVKGDGAAGFVGDDVEPDGQAMPYFGDYQYQPQVKLHADVSLPGNWRVWARYTQQGSNWRGNEIKTDFDGTLLNQQSVRDRQLTVSASHERALAGDLVLRVALSAESFDGERRGDNARISVPAHILNKKNDFSESELLARGVAEWTPKGRAQVAAGLEYSLDFFGRGWFNDKRTFRVGGDGHIVSGADSEAIREGNKGSADPDDNALFVGNGWATQTLSAFAESKLVVHERVKALVSGRLDKNSHSSFLLSPRAALMVTPVDRHVVRLIAQRALRMNTAAELLEEDRVGGGDAPSEELRAIELAYTGRIADEVTLRGANFWHDTDVIAFDGNVNSSRLVGTLRLVGVEGELDYHARRYRVGANYSYVKQLDWSLAEGVAGSGVSYADYAEEIDDGFVMEGLGNDLNNWPNQAIKVFGHVHLDRGFTVHANARALWDFQGGKDGLASLRAAIAGHPDEAAVLASLDRVAAEDVYGLDLRVNASVAYAPTSDVAIRIHGQNLLGTGGNKRYSTDSGNDDPAPRKVRFVHEPRAAWLTVGLRY